MAMQVYKVGIEMMDCETLTSFKSNLSESKISSCTHALRGQTKNPFTKNKSINLLLNTIKPWHNAIDLFILLLKAVLKLTKTVSWFRPYFDKISDNDKWMSYIITKC